jgi:hypothetical protein
MRRSLYSLVTEKGTFPINGFDCGRGIAKIKIGEVWSLLRSLDCNPSYHLQTEDGKDLVCLNPDLQTVWYQKGA